MGVRPLRPSKSQAAVDTLRRETALSFGIGALVWALILPSIVALALVVALLCITIIGIPLALAALLGYVLFLGMLFVWGYAVGAAVIGGQLSKRAQHTAVAGVAPQPEPSLQRSAAMGVLVLGGTAVIAQIMKSLGGVLYGLRAFIHVITIIFACLLTTAGAGAWLRAEFMTGTLGVWWRGRRLGGGGGPGIPVPPSPVPPPASPMASTPTGFWLAAVRVAGQPERVRSARRLDAECLRRDASRGLRSAVAPDVPAAERAGSSQPTAGVRRLTIASPPARTRPAHGLGRFA